MTALTTAARDAAPPHEAPTPAERRRMARAISGITLGAFAATLAATIVSAPLPRIMTDLGGTQSHLTWVITVMLLGQALSTPVWGRAADRFSSKILVQAALACSIASAAAAGFAQSAEVLIAFRAVQGIGAGGLTALSVVLVAEVVPPRERGRYMGVFGGVMAIAQVGGPLLGGVIADSPLGWRWIFFVAVPLGVAAAWLLQRTLHVTPPAPAAARRGGGAAALLRNRTVVLASVASTALGVVMIAAATFVAQYLQLARGRTPTDAGLLTVPMVVGTLLAGVAAGNLISRTGRYKTVMVTGGVALVAAMAGLAALDLETPLWVLGVALFVLGSAVGALMQNLVLAAQYTLPRELLGAGTAAVAFFRTIGGAVGVSVLGEVLAGRVARDIEAGLGAAGIAADVALGGGSVPDVTALPWPVREVVESAYAAGISWVFWLCVPVAAIALATTMMIREVPLGATTSPSVSAQVIEEGSH